MRYQISEGANKMLEPFDFQTNVLFKQYLNNYFQTGKNPQFDSQELRDMWFYLKVHELSEQIQHDGYGNYGTFAYIELRDCLSKNGTKISNRDYHLNKEGPGNE